MNDLVIGGMPQERKTLNLGDYAEEETEKNLQSRKDRYSLKPIRLTLLWSI